MADTEVANLDLRTSSGDGVWILSSAKFIHQEYLKNFGLKCKMHTRYLFIFFHLTGNASHRSQRLSLAGRYLTYRPPLPSLLPHGHIPHLLLTHAPA